MWAGAVYEQLTMSNTETPLTVDTARQLVRAPIKPRLAFPDLGITLECDQPLNQERAEAMGRALAAAFGCVVPRWNYLLRAK